MRAISPSTILLFVLLAAACAPKAVKMPASVQEDAQTFYGRAESYEARGESQKALNAYQEYVRRFPDTARSGQALMRMGAIYRAAGQPNEAIAAYEQVIAAYPRSARAADALVEILYTFYEQGAYDRVIARADEVLTYPVTTDTAYRTYSVLADAYRSTSQPEAAVRAFALAVRFAPQTDRAAALDRLKTAIGGLDIDQLSSLLGSLEDPLSRAYLLYRQGQAYLAAGRVQEAIGALTEFVDRYPSHEDAPQARASLDALRQQAAVGRFRVGCLLPLTGPSALFGRQALDGVEFALNRFHAADGVPAVELLVKDSASDPQTAAAAVRQLAEQGVVAIVGPIFTAAAAAAEAQQLQIPIITVTQKEDIAASGDYVFNNFFNPRMQVKTLVAYAVERLGIQRFAVLYPDEKYGQTFMNLFWDEVLAHGASVVAAESYPASQTDFADSIRKLAGPPAKIPSTSEGGQGKTALRTVDFEALFIPDAPRRAGLVIPQLAYNDLPPVQLLGTNLWHSDVLLTMARPYVQGAIMPDIFFDASETPQVKTFVDEFTWTYERKPGFVEAALCDTATMLLQILAEPGAGSRQWVRDRLARVSAFDGLTGPTTFDANGVAQKSLILMRIEGDGFVEVPH